MAIYSTSDITKPAIPDLPTSDAFLALADIITAPSTPKKQNSVTIMVDFICMPAVPRSAAAAGMQLRSNTLISNSSTKAMMMNKSITTLTAARTVLTIPAVRIPLATI